MRLKAFQKYKIQTWVRENHERFPEMTIEGMCAEATKETDLPVTVTIIRKICEEFELEWTFKSKRDAGRGNHYRQMKERVIEAEGRVEALAEHLKGALKDLDLLENRIADLDRALTLHTSMPHPGYPAMQPPPPGRKVSN